LSYIKNIRNKSEEGE